MSETTNMGGADEVETLQARLAEVERERDDWKVRASGGICWWCGDSSRDLDVSTHWRDCPKHPARADLAAARELLSRTVGPKALEDLRSDLAAEREARQRAEAKVVGLAAAVLQEALDNCGRDCCSDFSAICGSTDARPALDAAIEEAARPLRERVAGLAAALTEALDGWEDAAQYKGEYLARKHGDAEDLARLRLALNDAAPVLAAHVERETAALRGERDRLAAALRVARDDLQLWRWYGHARGADVSSTVRLIASADAALAGSDEALRAMKAQARREALEEAAKECWAASDELADRDDMISEQGQAQILATRIRALLDAPEKEADRE